MPESPRWLESKGRDADAEAVISAIEHQAAPQGGLPAPAFATPVVASSGALRDLFAPDMIVRTLIGSVMLIALNTAIYGFIAFLPTFMVKQGMNIVTSLNYTTIMMFGGPVGALIGLWLVDRVGRKPCIIWFAVLAAVFGALYPQTTDANLVTLLGFLLVTALYVLVAIGWSLYVPEMFPTEIRMRGAGFCNTAGRAMGIITPQIIVPLFAAAGVTGVIVLVAGLLLLMAALVAAFGIETRKKPLEALSPRHEGMAVRPLQSARVDAA